MATVQIDGVELYYDDLGEGEPLLVVHGAAASGRWFGDLMPRLAESYRVVVPDLRGLGRSQRVEALPGPRTWVVDMWRLLDHLSLDAVHLVGVSLGSRIVGRMALEQPRRVRSLTVDAPIIGISAQGNASLNNAFTVVDENSQQAQEWRELHGPDWQQVVAFYGRARSTPGLQEYLTVKPELAAIAVPTLVCRGDHDDSVHPIDDAFIWYKEAPRTELFIAPGLTQSSIMLERPLDFQRAFDGFLGRLPALQKA